MVAIIVAAHGETAPALLKTSGMILGEIEGVTPVTFLPGQGPEDLLEAYAAAVGPEEDVLLLVDLFGGSPTTPEPASSPNASTPTSSPASTCPCSWRSYPPPSGPPPPWRSSWPRP